MIWNKKHNLQTRIVQFTEQQKTEKVETVQIKLSKSKTQLKQFNDQQKVTKNVTWAIYRPHKKT